MTHKISTVHEEPTQNEQKNFIHVRKETIKLEIRELRSYSLTSLKKKKNYIKRENKLLVRCCIQTTNA